MNNIQGPCRVQAIAIPHRPPTYTRPDHPAKQQRIANPAPRLLPRPRSPIELPTFSPNSLSSMLRQRRPTAAVPSRPSPKPPPGPIIMDTAAEPLLPSAVPPPPSYTDPVSHPRSHDLSPAMAGKTPWLIYAVASGACAAFNGVFAKL